MKQIYVKALNNYHPKELEKLVLEQLVLPITECSQAITDHEFKICRRILCISSTQNMIVICL